MKAFDEGIERLVEWRGAWAIPTCGPSNLVQQVDVPQRCVRLEALGEGYRARVLEAVLLEIDVDNRLVDGEDAAELGRALVRDLQVAQDEVAEHARQVCGHVYMHASRMRHALLKCSRRDGCDEYRHMPIACT